MKDLRNEFPVLKTQPNLIYFDNGATTLKHENVISAEMDYLINNGANPHTNDFKNAYLSNQLIDSARTKVAEFINAKNVNEVIFTPGTTQSINQIAFGLINEFKKGDQIVVTNLEHSANLLPWIKVAKDRGITIKNADLNPDFSININQLKNVINQNTKVFAFAHISNTIGVENDVKEIVKEVRKINKNVIIVLDAAQSIAHTKVDVQEFDVDFLAFSAHKMYGPFGLGILWGKYEILNRLEPLIYGGGMSDKIDDNLIDYTLYDLPMKLEGGTPNISAIASIIPAINFLSEVGINNIKNHEMMLKNYFIKRVKEENLANKIEFYSLNNTGSLITFNVNDINPQDIATFLDNKYNIASRSGSHCARRISDSIKTKIALRISLGVYNTIEEIEVLITALKNSENFLDAIF
ncbi:aminotransferase class V-fold PLP-dependent enzyme [Mesoplasma photuris]|uniref:aminotransferase class V-fold PLP-dependent enzyme n=1 Tax=Mesoplasma photuris TaxID=217731 RepID=UPI0004E11788|nr:aminotransferase class V-fold PLP-dependent enzyme [Mesoplasma photuris]